VFHDGLVEYMIETAVGRCAARLAGRDEVAGVVGLRDEAARWLLGRGIEQWRPGDLPAGWFERLVEEGSVWLVQRKGELVATVTIAWADIPVWGRRDDAAGYLHGLVVDRRFSGAGLGRAVLAWAEQQIANSGRTLARLDCVRTNPKLRSYYEHAGYRHVGFQAFPEISWAQEVALYEKYLPD
jgi:GNAT superfamily N-acetyltransferase